MTENDTVPAEGSNSGLRVYRPPGFPRAVFDFRNYTPARALGLVLLLANLAYLGLGVGTYSQWTDTWWRPDAALKVMYMAYHVLLFAVVTGVCWLLYDRRTVEGYILSVVSTVFGALYFLSPIDLVPDMVPVAGQADDLVIGGSSVLLGLYGWVRNLRKNARTRRIGRMIEAGRYDDALAGFLENEGYRVERTEGKE
jgi:uncharacterized membrane protein YkvA (DUF1232 family)